MKMYSYRIKDEWYNDDGSAYDHKKKVTHNESDDKMYLIEKLKELQEQLEKVKKVFNSIHVFVLSVISFTNIYHCHHVRLKVIQQRLSKWRSK